MEFTSNLINRYSGQSPPVLAMVHKPVKTLLAGEELVAHQREQERVKRLKEEFAQRKRREEELAAVSCNCDWFIIIIIIIIIVIIIIVIIIIVIIVIIVIIITIATSFLYFIHLWLAYLLVNEMKGIHFSIFE